MTCDPREHILLNCDLATVWEPNCVFCEIVHVCTPAYKVRYVNCLLHLTMRRVNWHCIPMPVYFLSRFCIVIMHLSTCTDSTVFVGCEQLYEDEACVRILDSNPLCDGWVSLRKSSFPHSSCSSNSYYLQMADLVHGLLSMLDCPQSPATQKRITFALWDIRIPIDCIECLVGTFLISASPL
jgi:hypothetical protein